MEKEELVQYWLDSAESDLAVCETPYGNRHYDWCLFVGHLVLEKVLKALSAFAREQFDRIKELYQWLLTKF